MKYQNKQTIFLTNINETSQEINNYQPIHPLKEAIQAIVK